MRVLDVMEPEPVVAFVPGQRTELHQLFRQHGLVGVPVLKEGTRKLAGLVMRSDLFLHPEEDQVARLMNPNPITMYPQAHIREAAEIHVNARAPLLPVVNGSNDLLGLLTPARLLEGLRNHRGRVQTYLGHRVVPVHRATPLPAAVRVLRLTGATALPVLDDQGKLEGLVTDGDLLRHADATFARPRTPGARVELPKDPVESIMVRNLQTVGPLTSVSEAAIMMMQRGIHQMPVVDENGGLVDLLTDIDLIAALM